MNIKHSIYTGNLLYRRELRQKQLLTSFITVIVLKLFQVFISTVAKLYVYPVRKQCDVNHDFIQLKKTKILTMMITTGF